MNMRDLKPIHGGVRADHFLIWFIKWPTKKEMYLYFGSKKDADKFARRHSDGWPYAYKLKQVNRGKL